MPNPWEQPNAWAMPGNIQKYIALRERALQQQQQQQEPPTPADMVTAETMQGVNANRDAYNQQQVQAQMQPQQQPYLTPQSAHLLGLIVNNKDAYENADTYARLNNPNEKDEAVLSALANDMRTAAHAGNDRIRELAKVIGLDLNGYENVGYQDAYNTLQDRKAKEIAELMGNTGRYSVSTDQFYNDNYLALIGEGKSAREAKRIAGRRAQEYQADRVTYLRNAYNVHGRDGNYTNDIGVGILDAIAQENPAVAQVYATAYKLPTAAQDRYEKVEDEHLKHWLGQQDLAMQGQINAALAEQAYGHNSALAEQTYGHNARLKEQGHLYTLNEDTNRYTLAGRNQLDAIKLTAALREKDPSKVEELFGNFYQLGELAGLKGDELDAFARENTIRAAANYYLNGGKGGSGKGNSDEPKYTEKQNTFLNQAKNLFSMAKEDIGNEENINRFEALIKGVDGVTGLEGDKAVTMLDFPVGVRQELEDWLNALRGGYYKAHADDNKAAEYWSKVRDVAILEKTFPHENFNKYKKLRLWEINKNENG